jgi:Protein of unknown function (DUF4240)
VNQQEFWRAIEASLKAGGGDPNAQCEALVRALAELPVEEIVSFERLFNDYHSASYRADLWGAAFLLNDGCSDDGFDYFRAALIGLGEAVFSNALADPDSLAALAGDDGDELDNEDLLYVASRAYELKTGRRDFFELTPSRSYPALQGDNSVWSTDGDVDEKKARRLYPRLFKALG